MVRRSNMGSFQRWSRRAREDVKARDRLEVGPRAGCRGARERPAPVRRPPGMAFKEERRDPSSIARPTTRGREHLPAAAKPQLDKDPLGSGPTIRWRQGLTAVVAVAVKTTATARSASAPPGLPAGMPAAIPTSSERQRGVCAAGKALRTAGRYLGNTGPHFGLCRIDRWPRTACVMSARSMPMSCSNRSSKARSSRSAWRVRRQVLTLARMPRPIRPKKTLRDGGDWKITLEVSTFFHSIR